MVNKKDTPKCECGNFVKFLDFRRGYAQFCSVKCTAKSQAVSKKKKTTLTEKYGVDHYSKTLDYKTKFKQTCKEKYGVENPGQIKELKTVRARNKQLTFFNSIVEKAKHVSAPLFSFNEYTHLRDHSLLWKCALCGQPFTSNLLDKLPECPTCFPKGNFGGQSKLEKEILSEIKQFYNGEIVENSRSVIAPKELDLYFPDANFALEINGVYWHNSELLDRYYHYEKYRLCKEKGISLLMITDYEWETKRDVILKMIKHRLKIPKDSIFARRCNVVQLSNSEAKHFFDCNHINGFCKASVHYGLAYKDEIVAAISCSPNRFSKNKDEVEIIRFALGDYTVPGAFGKLFATMREIFYNKSFVSYADLRYGNGEVYLKTGFVESKITKPGYWYFVNNRLDHRLTWTKQKLVNLGFNKNKTEEEIMREDLKALKIYDCGHKLYKWSHK